MADDEMEATARERAIEKLIYGEFPNNEIYEKALENLFDAGVDFHRQQNKWTAISTEKDLPRDDKVYWFTYRDFYNKFTVYKGQKISGREAWKLGQALEVPGSCLVAYMPYTEPEPFNPQEK